MIRQEIINVTLLRYFIENHLFFLVNAIRRRTVRNAKIAQFPGPSFDFA